MMFILFVCYALSGYVLAVLDFARRKSAAKPPAAPLSWRQILCGRLLASSGKTLYILRPWVPRTRPWCCSFLPAPCWPACCCASRA